MAKVEEVPDDPDHFYERPPSFAQHPGPVDLLTHALDAFSTSTKTTARDGTTPALPPGLAALRDKTGPEILSELNKSPLFMTELEENNDLEAIRALAYEGTPYEVAAGFKERGNECFKEKAWYDAKEFYGKGVQVLLVEIRRRQRGEKRRIEVVEEEDGMEVEKEDEEEEVKKEIGVLETILVNRAAAHLELKNYRSCIMDCANALKINERNMKALYRSSKALLVLDRIAEAENACARGLAIDPKNKALKAVVKDIKARSDFLTSKSEKEREMEKQKKKDARRLERAIWARNIKVRKTAQPPELEDAKIELLRDKKDLTLNIHFPTVLLYPLTLESDFLKAFDERTSLGHHLEYIFPCPWDKKGEYVANGVECYMETISGGLVKVGKKVPLMKVLGTADVEVVDEIVEIFILPAAKAADWVQEFKEKKAAERGER